MASVIYFKEKKIKQQGEIIRLISKDNSIDKNVEKNDSLINKIDSVITIIYVDSAVYGVNSMKLIEENKQLKNEIYKQKYEKHLINFLRDSLDYYSVYK